MDMSHLLCLTYAFIVSKQRTGEATDCRLANS